MFIQINHRIPEETDIQNQLTMLVTNEKSIAVNRIANAQRHSSQRNCENSKANAKSI